ncbi:MULTISPECIES: dTDP-4-dehydrorhamnose reductase [Halocynthiibacter]|uniref:dTDP-4-dehydrorhamnose reductase n=1 Tax=Halocynthiibacter halioticoli TaxID=2986804 RepID=A0AAE3LS88_9RHOB|nr:MULTISPECIES: dTDP-4-dehydrorhamnose reductase [Halocynthiibacter]MCV6823106.1 dTDP-4-dehydrorhamnose reductase [Halocynthiibacter halioticoli]MCW4056107.1 dTDP-4-dehydrorhamnose reductase [Halocynthiibacter sp. SDUM655004]
MILVFGKNGQVARELNKFDKAHCIGRDEVNLERPEESEQIIRQLRPLAVINAAAYTNVDTAETEQKKAALINSDAPRIMAKTCSSLSIPFVHISTDYVFSGEGHLPWRPEDETDPINAYGRSKREGELGVLNAGGRSAVLRTSWVFSSYGTNFVKTMLRLGEEREEVQVVADQFGGPTSAAEIAKICMQLVAHLEADASAAGIYHFAGAPTTSWAGFAEAIFAKAHIDCMVTEVQSRDYPTVAKRPLNSRLCCEKLSGFGVAQPDWRDGLTQVIDEMGASA